MRSVLVHAHLFKNAGTTFDWSLQRSFGAGFFDHRDDDAMRGGAGYLGPYLQQRQDLQALSSHWITFPMPRLEHTRIALALFFRDPIERILSVYNFEKRQVPAETPGAKKAKELDFLDYVRWQMQPMPGPVVKNFHTRYCSGDYLGSDLDELYDKALQTVEATALTGLVHRYDESVVLFEYLLGQDFPDLDLSYQRQNVSAEGVTFAQRRQHALDELAPVMEEISRANSYDLRLFEVVEQKFERALARVPNLEARLEQLLKRNRRLA